MEGIGHRAPRPPKNRSGCSPASETAIAIAEKSRHLVHSAYHFPGMAHCKPQAFRTFQIFQTPLPSTGGPPDPPPLNLSDFSFQTFQTPRPGGGLKSLTKKIEKFRKGGVGGPAGRGEGTRRGSYSGQGVFLPSKCLHESPFLEPLLRTPLSEPVLPLKPHSKAPSKNPS